jgi:hydroxyacylglutathione hydrolase
LIDEFVALALAAPGAGAGRLVSLKQAMSDCLFSRLRAQGCTLDDTTCRDLLANDVELNSQGLLVWRDREFG